MQAVSHPYNERTACPGCSRTFRDTDSLVRQMSHNPEHADHEQWLEDWMVKEHTVETFRRLPGTPDSQSIRVSHDAASNSTRIDGVTAITIDTAPVIDRITGDV